MNKKPCKFDHNGECLICDSWASDCAYDRLMKKDFTLETEKELMELLKDYIPINPKFENEE